MRARAAPMGRTPMAGQTPHPYFEKSADRYEALVDWPRRLAAEAPFYRRWFAEARARRVLDAACGTGRHAALFHEWGLEVEGADVSAGMIDRCRRAYGEPVGLRWVERSYAEPADPPGRFDAVVCVGNSLALADSLPAAARAVAAMIASIRPGGLCIVQVLNLWRLPDGPTVWQKCVRTPIAGGDHVLLKSIRRTGDRGVLDFVDLELSPGGGVKQDHRSESLIGLRSEDLSAAARDAGAEPIAMLGSYQQEPYQIETSPDLILVCARRA